MYNEVVIGPVNFQIQMFYINICVFLNCTCNFFVFCNMKIPAFCYFPTGSTIDMSTLLMQSCKTLIGDTVVVAQSPADMERPSLSFCLTAFRLSRTEFLSLHEVSILWILWLCIYKDIMSGDVKHCEMCYNCHCYIWMNLYSFYDKVADKNKEPSANTSWWMLQIIAQPYYTQTDWQQNSHSFTVQGNRLFRCI